MENFNPDLHLCAMKEGDWSIVNSFGDEGSALVYSHQGNNVVIGIKSFYRDLFEQPSGYTQVINYVDWIKSVTGLAK